MESSDDKTNRDVQQTAVDTENTASVNADADGIVAPSDTDTHGEDVAAAESLGKSAMQKYGMSDDEAEPEKSSDGISQNTKSTFAGELVSITVKSIAVALSVIILLTCILAVALPLSAMRVFNKLGMSERAVDFGERYIARELDSYDADHTDGLGNYDILAKTPKLTNDDFLEALYVCTNLSYKLMESSYDAGDAARGKYYATRLEKYTRMYLSLNDVSAVNAQKSEYNIAHMPAIALRPVVYSYGHDIRVMNYRARAYLGTTGYVTFNSNSNGNSVSSLTEISQTYYGLKIDEINRYAMMSTLDGYIDYIAQIGEYLDVEFKRAGVENDLSKRVDVSESLKNIPVLTETVVNNRYTNYLNGDEFSLLLTKENGFSNIYTQLKRFDVYAQAAVDFIPSNLDEMLHQLYWLQELSSASRRLWYMSMLMYYNHSRYGNRSADVRAEYSTSVWQEKTFVNYDGRLRQIWDVYDLKLRQYMAQYQL